ncbi:MAG: ribose-phosphate pyrophosphokinase [Candidatus Micrarchaeota archaeon]|nr:ribose-phosphate pyrophosphokinase [Candidatus Micrarchaeota archaeon]
MIVLGQAGLPYSGKLAEELAEYYKGIKHYDFYFKQFGNTEYLIDIIGHDGKNSSNRKLMQFKKDMKKDGKVLVVVQGEYGEKWNSDLIVGTTEQIVEVLNADDIEYRKRLPKPEKLAILWTHSPFAKQDKLFADDNGNPMYGVPKTIKMQRKKLKNAGVDILFEIFPHDYRREGWIYKKAKKNMPYKVYTDWGKLPEKEKNSLVAVEDWRNFAWAIDPTALISDYIRIHIPLDVAVSPDFTADEMSVSISRDLGVWNAGLQKIRSRKDGRLTLKNHLSEIVKGSNVLIVDDMIYSGGTIRLAIEDAFEHGAKSGAVVAVHGQFTENALEEMKKFKKRIGKDIPIYTTDTIVNPFGKIETPRRVAKSIYNVGLNYPDIF